MTNAIPEPLVRAVLAYCRDSKGNALHVLSSVLRPFAAPTADVDTIATNALASAVLSPTSMFNAPSAISPHAPVPHTKKDYWVKVISSIDMSDLSAWGVKGRFILPSDTFDLPDDTLLLVATKFKRNTRISLVSTKGYLCKSDIEYPKPCTSFLKVSGSIITFFDNPTGYEWDGVFGYLKKQNVRAY